MKKREPMYTIADFAELKGINRNTFKNRVARSSVHLDDPVSPKTMSGNICGGINSYTKKLWPLSYLEKTIGHLAEASR